jgi:hypothetical protein
MIANATVEKTTTYNLTKQQVIDILLKEVGVDRLAGSMVKITFECTGGYDGYENSSYNPMDLYSAKIVITEKTKT